MKYTRIKKIFPVIVLVFVLTSFSAYYASHFPELVLNKISTYNSIDYPEKIYIHTDKPYYSINESIWFSVYLVNGISHAQSDKSKVLYVEIINDQDSILSKKKFHIETVSAAGDFKIPPSWKEGKYLLRGYTNEMRNQDVNFFFQKEISIWAKVENDTIQNFDQSLPVSEMESEGFKLPRPDLHFYPEGGYLVEGHRSKVAIKVKNDIFNAVNVSGTIYDNEGIEISKFETVKYGLGFFSIVPKPNKSYYARVNLNGFEESYPLPKVLPKGFSMNTFNNGEEVIVHVNSTIGTGLKGSFLVVHQRGKLIFENFEKAYKNEYSIKILTENLKEGVTHLTLFDAAGNPVCERLVYIKNSKNRIKVDIHKSKNTLKSREKITVDIAVKDIEGLSVPSQLSMSVRDLTAIPQKKYTENIRTWLLLNSDLRGEVKDPGYFFEKDSDNRRNFLLDLVMLTNGWRRFTWNELLYNYTVKREFPVEKGLFISGRTMSLKKPYPYTKAATRISFVGSFHQETKKSNEKGAFKYGPYIFFDTIPTLLEARLTNFNSEKAGDRKVLIKIDKPIESPKIVRNRILKSAYSDIEQVTINQKIANYIREINFEFGINSELLDEVVITGKQREERDLRNEEMNERTMYGEPTNRMVMEDIIGSGDQSVFNLLRRLPGIKVSGTQVSIRGGGTPSFYLDGMEIDSSFVETISGRDIAFIDVLKGADAAVFSFSGNGVIAMYSAAGANIQSKNVRRKPGIIDFNSVGFYTAKEFYAPRHSGATNEIYEADVRTTLHWDPDITITENKRKAISFYTCDAKGEYIIEIEGISDAGIPIYGTSKFFVE